MNTINAMIAHAKVYLVVFFLSFIYLSASSQDWKTSYDLALKSYQNQEYSAAIKNGEIAYAKATDLKNKTHTLQLITAACLEINLSAKGLSFVEEEIALFKTTEGVNSKNYAEALKKQISFYEMKEDFISAATKMEVLVPILGEIYGVNSTEWCLGLLRQGNILVSLGKYSLAKEPLVKCLDQLKQNNETIEAYFTATFLCSVVNYKLNDLSAAEKKLKIYLGWAEQNNLQNSTEYKSAKSILSEIILAAPKESVEAVSNESFISDNSKTQYYLKIGQAYQQKLKLDSAIKYYDICEKIIDKGSLENNNAFSVFINAANVWLTKKNLIDAGKKLERANQLAEKLYNKKSIEYCYLYIAQADLLKMQGQTVQAEEKYLAANEAIASLPLQSKLQSQKSITQKLLAANRFKSALAVIEPLALDSVSMSTLEESEFINVSTLYCTVLQTNHNITATAYLTKQISRVKSEAGKNDLEIQFASLLIRSGETNKALNLLSEIIKTQHPNTISYANAAYELARLQQRVGQFNEAEKYYLEAIKSYQALSLTNQEELSEAYNSLATSYMTLGNYEAAEHLYDGLIKQTDPNSEFYSVLRQNLATIYEQTMRYNEAKKLLEETLQRDKFILGTSHPDYAVTVQNLAVLYQKTGELNKARSLFNLALKIDKENSGEQSLAYASKLANLGTVYQELGEFDKARTYYENALSIREIKIGKEHPDYVFNQYNLAVLYQRQHDFANAYPLFKAVTNFYLNQINELFPSFSELEKTAFYNKINEVIIAYQDFAIENRNKDGIAGEIYNFRLATKALLLNASTKIRNRIVNSGDEVLLSRFTEWQHAKEDLAKLYVLELDEKENQQQHIEILQQKANDLEKYLSSQSELFANHNDNKNVSWQNVKAGLKPGEAAIEMIRLKMNQSNDSIIYAALILRYDDKQPSLIILPNGEELEGREFFNYKNCVQFQIANNRSYSLFWQPLNTSLKGIHNIYFSPDGVYNKINLETLYDPSTNEYLIDRMNVYLVSNTKEVLNQSEKLPAIAQATLLGFPDYNLANIVGTSAQLRDVDILEKKEIPALPGTKEELLKINELLKEHNWKIKLYMQESATEENIKALHNPTILHIATHGFFIESLSDKAPIIFSKDLSKQENNPLLRSGLLLAGAANLNSQNSNRGDDGILTALEAMNLNLDKTNLVVLSACETGSGQIRNGEGVFGLQRSFLVSGANSIMMSLWKVSDDATQELMVEFYKNWLTSNDKAGAFRKTQLTLRKKYTDPYFWGGFIMMGK